MWVALNGQIRPGGDQTLCVGVIAGQPELTKCSSNSRAQLWRVAARGQIKQAERGLCLTVKDGKVADSSPLVADRCGSKEQRSQLWQMSAEPVGTVPSPTGATAPATQGKPTRLPEDQSADQADTALEMELDRIKAANRTKQRLGVLENRTQGLQAEASGLVDQARAGSAEAKRQMLKRETHVKSLRRELDQLWARYSAAQTNLTLLGESRAKLKPKWVTAVRAVTKYKRAVKQAERRHDEALADEAKAKDKVSRLALALKQVKHEQNATLVALKQREATTVGRMKQAEALVHKRRSRMRKAVKAWKAKLLRAGGIAASAERAFVRDEAGMDAGASNAAEQEERAVEAELEIERENTHMITAAKRDEERLRLVQAPTAAGAG